MDGEKMWNSVEVFQEVRSDSQPHRLRRRILRTRHTGGEKVARVKTAHMSA